MNLLIYILLKLINQHIFINYIINYISQYKNVKLYSYNRIGRIIIKNHQIIINYSILIHLPSKSPINTYTPISSIK